MRLSNSLHRTAAGLAVLAVLAGAGPLHAQAAVTRGWHPWLGATIGPGAVDVQEGTNNVGFIGEVAGGLRWRPGFGVGARLMDWTRPNLLSSGDWNGTTVTGFGTYSPQASRYVDLTGGFGWARLHRNCSTCPPLTIHSTVGELGIDTHLNIFDATELRLIGIREFNLNSSGTGETADANGVSLNQWYIGFGLLYRWR